jgi:hypothetical protein
MIHAQTLRPVSGDPAHSECPTLVWPFPIGACSAWRIPNLLCLAVLC